MTRLFYRIIALSLFAFAPRGLAEIVKPVSSKPVIVIGTSSPSTWPPALPHADAIYGLVSRPVIGLDATNEWFCYLCVELPRRVEEVTADNDLFTLRFQIAATWGDMDPLAAEDLAAGLKYLQASSVPPAQRELLARLISIQPVPGAKNEVFVTAKGSEDLALLALAHLYPLHQTKKPTSVEALTAAMRKSPTDARWYLGPYFLNAAAPNSAWQLVPAEPSNLAHIEVRFYQNPDSLQQRFLEGVVDVIPTGGLTRDAQSQLLQAMSGQKIVKQPGYFFEHIDLNLRNPVFIDRNVRHALALAIDRSVLAKAMGKDMGTPHNGAWISTSNSEPEWYVPRIDEANRLLNVAGWDLTKEGKRVRDETHLQISLVYPAGEDIRKLLAQEIAGMWESLGVRVNIEEAAKEDFYDQILAKTRFQGVALYAWRLLPFVVPASPFHSGEIPLVQNDYRGQNISSWQNRNVDQIIEQWVAATSDDFGASAAQFQSLYREDVPQIPLFLWNEIVFVQPRVEGVTFPSRLAAASLSATQWTLQPPQKGSVKP